MTRKKATLITTLLVTAYLCSAESNNVSNPEGSSSVRETIRQDLHLRSSIIDSEKLEALEQRYIDFKTRMADTYGWSYGADYNIMMQGATDSLGESFAASGALRFYGIWEAVAQGADNAGTLTYKVENRHKLGTDIAPKKLGAEIGYAGFTSSSFSDAGWMLSNIYWNQRMFKGRFSTVAGVVDTTDYVNTYGLGNPWRDFVNLAFINDQTIPSPGQGLGAAVSFMPVEHLYFVAGLADANGDPTHPENMWDNFWSVSEYFTHAEIGWAGSQDNKYSDNIHLTLWHADSRVAAGIEEGWGTAFSACYRISKNLEPFLRVGHAEDGGALWESSVSTGFGYEHDSLRGQVGLGFNWGRPMESTLGTGLRDQYTTECFYRVQLLNNLAITPSAQLLIHPALNPNEDAIAVFGLRIRINL